MSSDKITMYDIIKSFDIDAMAEFITELCSERDRYCLERLREAGIDATLVQLAREIQVENNKFWLLSSPSEIPYDF